MRLARLRREMASAMKAIVSGVLRIPSRHAMAVTIAHAIAATNKANATWSLRPSQGRSLTS